MNPRLTLSIFLICVITPFVSADQKASEKDTSGKIGKVPGKIRNLRRANIESLPVSKSGVKLDESIREMQAKADRFLKRFKDRRTEQSVSSASKNRKNATVKKVKSAAKQTTKTVKKTPTTKPVKVVKAAPPKPNLEKFKKLLAEKIHDPVALADSLYKIGNVEAAAIIYEKALKLIKKDKARTWLMFQLGNCYRKTDPTLARGYYMRLFKQGKNPWTMAAQVQVRLIEWRDQNKPDQILKDACDCATKGNS